MSDTQSKVKEVIMDVLKIDDDNITLETRFIEDLKADSMDQFFLIDGFCEKFDIVISDEDARVIQTVGDAVKYIDLNTTEKPYGYMVNCAYPTFLCADTQPGELFERLIGYQANASSLDHCDLDGADQLVTDAVSEWGQLMIDLNRKYGIRVLGGCCGTSGDHLKYIVRNKG